MSGRFPYRLALLAALVGAGLYHSLQAGLTVRADPTSPFADVDDDLLPDSLEHVLLTRVGSRDTDGNGVDDFLQSAQNEPPMGGRKKPAPVDHEMRVVVSSVRGVDGRRRVVVHMIARILGGFGEVKQFEPFLDVRGERVPIGELFGSGLVHMGVRVDPKLGTYVIVSSTLGTEDEVRKLLPCAVGAVGVIGTRTFRTGSYLLDVGGVLSAIIPVDERNYAVQTLAPLQDPKSNPFWRSNRACMLELQLLGRSGGARLCEIRDAGCRGAPTLHCAPSCAKMNGGILVLPYGPGLLRGG